MLVLGLSMELPEGKAPGYYAQIVKGVAAAVRLLDRDKELLILERREDEPAVREVLDRYQVPAETIELLLLPEEAELRPAYTDYGFTTRLGRAFLYAEQAALFRVEPAGGERPPEPASALAQMEEHLLASWPLADGTAAYAADSALLELMEGIARAYGCRAQPVDPEER